MDTAYKRSTIEALILASPEPIAVRKITSVIEDLTSANVAEAIADLNERYAEVGNSFRIREIAGGYQFYVLPEYVGYIEELFARRRKLRLTRAALETAAIVAYSQPVTKIDIEHIRGVASDGVLHNLLEKKLITIVGRANTVGKPLQYGTTDEFLKFFGLNSIKDLPKMAEIEELIAASEPTDQTELTLIRAGEEEMVKLNVADGTFDPGSRDLTDEEDEMIPITRSVESPSDEAEELVQFEPANEEIALSANLGTEDSDDLTDELLSADNRMVLKSPVPRGTYGPVGAEDDEEDI